MANTTNPDQEPEVNPNDNPEPGIVTEPTTPEPAESTMTPEQIQQMQVLQTQMREANITDPQAFMADYTRKSQALSEATTREQQWAERDAQQRDAIGRLTGHVAATQDPVLAAQQNYQYVLENNSYDTAAVMQAQNAVMDARLAQEKSTWMQEAQAQSRMQSQLAEAKRILGTDDDNAAAAQLQQVLSGANPVMLAKMKLMQDGKYDEWATQQQTERDHAANQAALLNSLGTTGGRGVPGSGQPQQSATVPQWNFDMWNKETRERALKSGARIVDGTGEDVTAEYGG